MKYLFHFEGDVEVDAMNEDEAVELGLDNMENANVNYWEVREVEIVGKDEEPRTYYMLPVDQYGQPDGTIREIALKPSEYDALKKTFVYIYDKYVDAAMRADN